MRLIFLFNIDTTDLQDLSLHGSKNVTFTTPKKPIVNTLGNGWGYYVYKET